MTIAFITEAHNNFVGTGSFGGPTTYSLTINAPTSIAAGNLLIAVFWVEPFFTGINATAWSGPSGWTKDSSFDTESGASGEMSVWWKVATSSEPSTYTFSVTLSFAISPTLTGNILQYSSVDHSTPMVNTAFGHTPATTDNQLNAPSIAGVAGQRLVCAWTSSSGNTGLAPTGMTTRSIAGTGGAGAAQVCDKPLTTTGATGTQLMIWGGSQQGVSVSLALVPAPVTTVPQAQLINA